VNQSNQVRTYFAVAKGAITQPAVFTTRYNQTLEVKVFRPHGDIIYMNEMFVFK
jgi:hypothetical protein